MEEKIKALCYTTAKDLIKWNDVRANTPTFRNLRAYENEPLIAYCNNWLGCFILFKGNKKWFAYIIRNPEVFDSNKNIYGGGGSVNYGISRIENLKSLFWLINSQIKDNLVIQNQEELNKLQKLALLEAMEDK